MLLPYENIIQGLSAVEHAKKLHENRKLILQALASQENHNPALTPESQIALAPIFLLHAQVHLLTIRSILDDSSATLPLITAAYSDAVMRSLVPILYESATAHPEPEQMKSRKQIFFEWISAYLTENPYITVGKELYYAITNATPNPTDLVALNAIRDIIKIFCYITLPSEAHYQDYRSFLANISFAEIPAQMRKNAVIYVVHNGDTYETSNPLAFLTSTTQEYGIDPETIERRGIQPSYQIAVKLLKLLLKSSDAMTQKEFKSKLDVRFNIVDSLIENKARPENYSTIFTRIVEFIGFNKVSTKPSTSELRGQKGRAKEYYLGSLQEQYLIAQNVMSDFLNYSSVSLLSDPTLADLLVQFIALDSHEDFILRSSERLNILNQLAISLGKTDLEIFGINEVNKFKVTNSLIKTLFAIDVMKMMRKSGNIEATENLLKKLGYNFGDQERLKSEDEFNKFVEIVKQIELFLPNSSN